MPDPDEAPRPQILRALAGSLWFPALFFFGFMLCYLLPFHAPFPRHVPVAVAPPGQAAATSRALDAAAPGSFDIRPAADAADARGLVLSRDVIAAYTVAGGQAVLYTATAAGASLEQVASTTFGQLAAHEGLTLRAVDLVPLASGDGTGAGMFYLAMAWNVVGYITVMMMLRADLTRRGKVLTLVGVGAVAAVAGYAIGVAVDVIPGNPLAILYAFLATQAIGWTAFGLAPFVKQYLPGVAVLLFILLSLPSSGGAIPYQLVPVFFRALNPVMPLGNLIDALRGLLYFGGTGLLRPTLVLCAWMAAGAALIAAGAVRQRRQARQPAGTTDPEQPVEDPSFQMPSPHPLRPEERDSFGRTSPGLGGTVRQQDGEPVPEAFLTLLEPGGRQLTHTRTDSSGRYAFAGLPEEPVIIVLLAGHFLPGVTQVLVQGGHPKRQDFTLTPSS